MEHENSDSSETVASVQTPPDQNPPPEQHSPSNVLSRSLTGVLTYWRQLEIAIQSHDFDAVEGIAARAVNLWLTARAAFRRLIRQSTRPTPILLTAREAIEDTYGKLVERFGHATKIIAVPRTAKALGELRRTMDAARAHPLQVGTDAGGEK